MRRKRHLEGKAKSRHGRHHENPEGKQSYSSTLSLTSALGGGGWLTPLPSRFTPRKKTRYPLYRKLGGPQGRFERVRKISSPPEFDLRTVQPAASRYTDRAIPAPATPRIGPRNDIWRYTLKNYAKWCSLKMDWCEVETHLSHLVRRCASGWYMDVLCVLDTQ